jgi:hypothetical protein
VLNLNIVFSSMLISACTLESSGLIPGRPPVLPRARADARPVPAISGNKLIYN